jgi:formylmethanofuran dehydrogenase subunit E
LRKKQFFGRCQECGELNPSGWMHDSKICQHCAETNHGVVY